MVDIVDVTYTVVKVKVYRHRSDYIVDGYMFMIEFIDKRTEFLLFFERNLFRNAAFYKFVIFKAGGNEPYSRLLRLLVVLFVFGFIFVSTLSPFFEIE